MNQRDGTNYYDILEVPTDAPQSEIHKAYQRAKQTYSSENPALYSMFSKDEARELLKMIEEAYQVLGNNQLRQNYDETLRNGGASSNNSVHNSAANPVAISRPVSHSTSTMPQQSGPPDRDLTSDFGSKAETEDSSPTGAVVSTESGVQKKRESSSKSSLPAGTGRTPLSTYKIDDAFEAEISAASTFDGPFIQKVRQYRNITIDKLSESTRISRPYLMALETNDYKSLPAAVFVRGFVVQVARSLVLDENKVAASYMKIFKAGGGK